jgi:hypothetical protein
MRTAVLAQVCGCASRNEQALSHQLGVVRQRPAFRHRIARIETARLEKFPTNVLTGQYD